MGDKRNAPSRRETTTVQIHISFWCHMPRKRRCSWFIIALCKDTMEIHLRHISSQIPAGRHAVVVLDKAGWHTTKKLPHFQNLTLLSLPAASPELNPCEQVWKHLRRTRLSNRTFKDEEELLDACSDAWNEFILIVRNNNAFERVKAPRFDDHKLSCIELILFNL